MVVVLAEPGCSCSLSVETRSTECQHQPNTIDGDLLGLVTHLPGPLQRSILGGVQVRQAVLEVLSTQGNSQAADTAPHDHNRVVLEFVQGLLNELA